MAAYQIPFGNTNITKQSDFTNTQQAEVWASRTLQKVNSTEVYNWPRLLVRKEIYLGENRGAGPLKMTIFKPLPNSSVKPLAHDQTTVQEPAKGGAYAIQVSTQRFAVWMMATDTMMTIDTYHTDWKVYYRTELARLFLYQHQKMFQTLVNDGTNTNAIGIQFSPQADGKKADTIAQAVSDISWDLLLKIKYNFDHYQLDAVDGSKITTRILKDTGGSYTVVLDSQAHKALVEDPKFLNYNKSGVDRPEVDTNTLTSYLGMTFKMANSPWTVQDASNNVRHVGIFLGGGKKEPAFAKVSYSRKLDLEWIEKGPGKSGLDPLNQISGTFGWKGYIGYGIIYNENAYRIIYKRA